MSLFLADTPFSAVLWLALKATTILAAAALLQTLWRRRTSAATRHLAWTLVVASLLLLPIAWRVAPRWSVAAAGPAANDTTALAADPATDHGSGAAGVAAATVPDVAPAGAAPREATIAGARPVSAWMAALGIYVVGLAGVLLSLALHHWRTRRLAAQATELLDGPWIGLLAAASAELGVRRPVRLLRSREVVLPMTFGTRAPWIVIPTTADLWSVDRRRAVLLHELAHVARYDCLTQTLALIACAAYWPHPAVWWVARQLRVERELACDDRVLAAGAEAQAYAGHLLDIAYSLGGRQAPALAVSMARPSQLEGRLLAALDDGRNRRSPGLVVRLALGAAASAAVLALAGATPIAIETAHHGDGVLESVGAAVGTAMQDDLPGTWELRPTKTAGMVHLRLVEGDNTRGTSVPLASLEGLTEAQLAGAGGPVQFRITRDAGTLQFEGVLRSGVAAGTFSFTPNAGFPAGLVKRGFTAPTAREQYQLARADIGYAFLDELNRLGYAKPDTAGLVKAGQHGVDVTYLRDMGALGYALGSLPPLITLRDHGVTPDYVRGMAQEGYAKLPADTLRQARDHGVGPEYVKGMREAGYAGLTLEALINARDHGVTPEYVRALADGGYRGLPLDQVVRVRDHGITPDYISGMRQLGYTLAIEDLVRARDHGVDTQYVRDMAGLGFERTPIDRLITVRDHGVTPAYAKELKALGYDTLTLDDLVLLRDHGVTPDRVRSANARAGTRLSIDMLRSLADGGGLR
jgi:beta-lactamase regulating signal transducer with metallopeptidase domain